MEFTKLGFDVYTSEVNDKGIDFVVCTTKPRRHHDVQVKSVRGFNYIFFRKEYFDPRDDLFAAVVMLFDGKPPELYLIPTRLISGTRQPCRRQTTRRRSKKTFESWRSLLPLLSAPRDMAH